jgi:hypothetical protein
MSITTVHSEPTPVLSLHPALMQQLEKLTKQRQEDQNKLNKEDDVTNTKEGIDFDNDHDHDHDHQDASRSNNVNSEASHRHELSVLRRNFVQRRHLQMDRRFGEGYGIYVNRRSPQPAPINVPIVKSTSTVQQRPPFLDLSSSTRRMIIGSGTTRSRNEQFTRATVLSSDGARARLVGKSYGLRIDNDGRGNRNDICIITAPTVQTITIGRWDNDSYNDSYNDKRSPPLPANDISCC